MRISDWSSDVCSSDLRSIEFADRVGADAIVLHRYWGLVFGEGAPRAVDKASAEIAFNEVLRDLADAASGKRLLVENVGHYSLLPRDRSEEHTSELQSLMRISYAVFCLKKKKHN